MRKPLYYNNHISSQQDQNRFFKDLFEAVIDNSGGIITMVVDDGDGDIWKYTIDIECERIDKVTQVIEN